MDGVKGRAKVVGWWFNDKKCHKFRVTELQEECRRRGIELVKIDLSRPLEEQGPFDLILHKLTALYAQALSHDVKALAAIKAVEQYLEANPKTILLDPLPGVRRLLQRHHTYHLLHLCTRDDERVFTPTYAKLTTAEVSVNKRLLAQANVTFPMVCKPVTAGGTKEAHEMDIVFNESGIAECSLPCVAQSFVNHGAVLYKLFVLGPVWFVVVRPSLKNFYPGVEGCYDTNMLAEQETVHFNSHHVSKENSQSPLSQLDPADKDDDLPKADPAVFNRIVTELRKALQMDLLGIDVVIDSNTGHYAIIDVNALPSYDSVPDLMRHLVDLMVARMDPATPALPPFLPRAPHDTPMTFLQEDSGVDTG